MDPTMTTTRLVLLAALAAPLLPACGGKADGATAAAPAPPTILARDNVIVADSALIESGPLVSGTLRPKLVAVLRAQVGGRVLDVLVEEGQRVRAGQVLARIDQAALQDAVLGARAQVRSAELALQLAERDRERTERLGQAGALAERDLEAARSAALQAQAALDDARARLRSAEEQLGYTTVRAPFAGVVVQTAARPGDVLQAGNEVVTVVDPSLLELEASVPVEQYRAVRVGAPVTFGVGSLPGRAFRGRVARVNAVLDPQTRQVTLYVDVPNADGALVAGLFAEGRLADRRARAIVIPLQALDQREGAPAVLRVAGGRVERVTVELGLRDEVAESVAVVTGVSRGDTLLVGGALTVSAGTPVRVAQDR